MTCKEAHKYLENLQREFTKHRQAYANELISANGMAILALEKQIAKTPKAIRTRYSGGVKKGICPNCLIAEDNSANYCRACGQRLDWGE